MKKLLIAMCSASLAAAALAARPEDGGYSSVTNLTGQLGDVGVSAERVVLKDATIAGTLSIDGDAELWLEGASTITTSAETALSCSGNLVLCGTGSLSTSSAGAKKRGVIVADGLVVAGGDTSVTVAGDVKNVCGVSLSGCYTQLAGALRISASGSKKQNGVFLAGKNAVATITGGVLECELAGEKSVGLAMDKASSSCTMAGGVIRFALSGYGSKGVKGDGAFLMSGGLVDATLTGGAAEDYYTTEDDDGNDVYYTVTLTSSTKTSGATRTCSTSSLIGNGTYAVMDPSKSYAVKTGTLSVSGGTVRVRATGTAGRGLGADNMYLSGGVFDISVAGGPTDVYVEMLDEDALTTCLDADGAACLKTGATDGVMQITGGRFELAATGPAGKLINAAGKLVVGTSGSATSPSASAFVPDIQGRTLGAKVFCASIKQKYYGSLATAVATDAEPSSADIAKSNLKAGSGDDVDYSNPKGIKAKGDIAMYAGRIRVQTANDGGEGFESKGEMTIDGGLLELVCADDCINSGEDLHINGGYIYAGSTGNDAIDSNGKIYVTGGVTLAFTATAPEVGIDTDDSSGFVISGGTVVSVGSAADNMVIGSSGSQKTYKTTSASASTYAGKYLKMSGTKTVTVKIPSMSSSSGSISIVCTTDGWSSAKTPSVSASAPSSGDIGFHGVYIQ